MNRDPLGEKGGINLYGSVGANPIYWVDPWGLHHGDKDYGYSPEFWDWYHDEWKEPGDPDASPEVAEEAFDEWEKQGRPDPKEQGKKRKDRKDKRGSKWDTCMKVAVVICGVVYYVCTGGPANPAYH